MKTFNTYYEAMRYFKTCNNAIIVPNNGAYTVLTV